jgi:glycosyltransferase involved in cell wall biosynthesis
MNLLFVTSVDLSGTGGASMATAHIIAALAQNPLVDLTLVCPELANRPCLPGLDSMLGDAYSLPKKTRARDGKWHIGIQIYMLRAFQKLAPQIKDGVVVGRLSPPMLAPPLLARRLDVPYILLARGMMVRNLEESKASSNWIYMAKLISRINARAASKVYAAFDEVKEWVDGYRLPGQEKAQVLPNAADTTLFRPMSAPVARERIGVKLTGSDFVIGFVGCLHKRHGLKPLIRAFARFRHQREGIARLLVVGDGPQRLELEDLVHQEGLQGAVIFTGFVAHVDVPFYIGACDILYGVTDPNFVSNPMKCYEYLACEKPIVTTANKTLSFVQERCLGSVVQSLDPAEIAEAIETLYLAGDEERKAMGKRGREYVIEHHTWDRFADAVVDGAMQLLG